MTLGADTDGKLTVVGRIGTNRMLGARDNAKTNGKQGKFETESYESA